MESPQIRSILPDVPSGPVVLLGLMDLSNLYISSCVKFIRLSREVVRKRKFGKALSFNKGLH